MLYNRGRNNAGPYCEGAASWLTNPAQLDAQADSRRTSQEWADSPKPVSGHAGRFLAPLKSYDPTRRVGRNFGGSQVSRNATQPNVAEAVAPGGTTVDGDLGDETDDIKRYRISNEAQVMVGEERRAREDGRIDTWGDIQQPQSCGPAGARPKNGPKPPEKDLGERVPESVGAAMARSGVDLVKNPPDDVEVNN